MKRIVALALATVALASALAAGAAVSTRIIQLKPGARIDYRGITCATKSETLDVLICFSKNGPYRVTIGKKSVAIVRSGNGKLVFAVPTSGSPRSTPAALSGKTIAIKPGSQINFHGIQCISREANYNLLACVSATNPYAVSVSKTSVVVTRDQDGKIVFFTQ